MTIAFCASMHAQPLSKYLSPDLLAKVRISGGSMETTMSIDAGLKLKPLDKSLDNLQSMMKLANPDILVEALYLCPLPPDMKSADGRRGDRLAIYNILRAVGSLQGIEYYSASRKRRTVLFEESWRIRDAQSRDRLPDGKLSALPESETLWAWQKDASLGSAVYRVDYSTAEDALSGVFSNQTDIKFGPVALAKKQAMEIRLYVFMSDEGILLYLLAQARIAVLPGLAGKFKASLENRLEALHSWFSASL